MERPDDGFVLGKERVVSRGKSDEGLLKIETVIQLGSSIELTFSDKILDQLFKNPVRIFEKDDLVLSDHGICPV
jgi:hypothetical protein